MHIFTPNLNTFDCLTVGVTDLVSGESVMCTVDLTAWSSGGLFKIELCRFNRVQKFIGKLAKNLSRHCQLSSKIEVVTVRQTRRFGLHPVDS